MPPVPRKQPIRNGLRSPAPRKQPIRNKLKSISNRLQRFEMSGGLKGRWTIAQGNALGSGDAKKRPSKASIHPAPSRVDGGFRGSRGSDGHRIPRVPLRLWHRSTLGYHPAALQASRRPETDHPKWIKASRPSETAYPKQIKPSHPSETAHPKRTKTSRFKSLKNKHEKSPAGGLLFHRQGFRFTLHL